MPDTPTGQWTPRPGVGKSPLMHLAYHITDDRYDHVKNYVAEKRMCNMLEDSFDKNEWLLSFRSRALLIGHRIMKHRKDLIPGDDELNRFIAASLNEHRSEPTALVGTNENGNVIVRWLNPSCRGKWVNIAAVMNKGTYCVPEFCPASKAHRVFTSLGLRHLVVLGGADGGHVVGIITRINLLKDFIERRIGYPLE